LGFGLTKNKALIFTCPWTRKNPKISTKLKPKKLGMIANEMTVEPSDYLATY
jgi:hypothetical protein